ncbi:MAG: AAA family ATPase [Phycisphaerales bacterium]|nr:AAA family ATPase [Phycisphaerales bacterium]
MSIADRLTELARAEHRCVRIVTMEEAEALAEVVEAAMSLDCGLRVWTAVQGVYDGMVSGSAAVPHTENAASGLFEMSRTAGRSLLVLLDSCAHLDADARTLRAWRELVERCQQTGSCVVMIDAVEHAPAVVDAMSVRIEPALPDAPALERTIRETVKRLNRSAAVKAEMSREDLQTLVMNLRGLTRRQTSRLIAEATLNDTRLSIEDLPTILEGKRRLIQSEGVLESITAPVSMDHIGGMSRLKAWLAQRTDALSADAATFGLIPPRGLLLLGVQGGGKSLCAKAVATAWRRPLLRMDVGALYDRYIGESERRLRAAFEQAETMAPIVLWIDEIEKAFASAASQSSDGGLSRRMFGSLLTWMQEHQAPVFVVATANDIEALPPELLRKGRFDEIFFVDLPGPASREQIFRIHLAKRKRDPSRFDLPRLVACSEGFSGAEIEQAIMTGLYDARAAGRELDTDLICNVLAHSPPLSVTMAERMQELREWARGRCVPAD